ncbi:MAG: hypothetical protein Q9174_002509 [Haloplaca sp. 1 TL-2023]
MSLLEGLYVIIMIRREAETPKHTALFYALISDYNLNDSSSIAEARQTLDILKQSAADQDGSSFDPSATTRPDDEDGSSNSQDSERARSWHGDAVSRATDSTSISRHLSSLSVHDHHDGLSESDSGLDDPDSLTTDQKISSLCEMFPTVKVFDIEYTLKKSRFDFGKAVEELLNQAFIDSEAANGGERAFNKGVEAFLEPASRGRKHKGKRKRQARRTSSTPAPSDISHLSSAALSRWDRAKEDVEFLAERTYLTNSAIRSIYHASGGNVHTTIMAICTSFVPDQNPHIALLDPTTLDAHTGELVVDFPLLPYSTAQTLIQLTHPSTASAHEIAGALSPPSAISSLPVPHYSPRPPSPPSEQRQPIAKPLPMPLDLATSRANASSAARSSAFTQANAAYRRSKSKPLMAGAASYYSSVGRAESASLRRYEAAAADAHVTSQSRAGEIDLHGVNVKDAVRIAEQRVALWWEVEGREWAREGKVMGGNGLRIVTGVGRHSEGGRGKLGPAVGTMLVREGWKVEIGQGVVTVVGRVRK